MEQVWAAVYKADRMAIAYSNFNLGNTAKVFTGSSILPCSTKAINHGEVAKWQTQDKIQKSVLHKASTAI